MNEKALKVHCIDQEYWYVRRQRCACGGELEQVTQALRNGPTGEVDALTVQCKHCGAVTEYEFDISTCGGAAYITRVMERIRQCSKVMSTEEAVRALGPPMESALRLISDLAQQGDVLGLDYLSDAIAHARERMTVHIGTQETEAPNHASEVTARKLAGPRGCR